MANRFLVLVCTALVPVALTGQAPNQVYQAIDLGTLPNPLTNTSYATGINNRRQVVGISYVRTSPDRKTGRAFLWTDGTMSDLGTLPGGTTSVASGINNRGDIVGSSDNGVGQNHAVLLAARIYRRSWRADGRCAERRNRH